MVKQNIVGALREQSDWEQQNENRLGFIKNKPFYDTRKTAPLSLSHDGNIEGLEAIYFPCYEATYYKISETVPTYEESIQGEGIMRIFLEGVQDEEILFTTAATIGNFSTFWLVEHDNANVPVCFFLSEDTVFSGGSIWGFETDTKVTKGIWIVSFCYEMEGVGHFEMFVKSLSFPSVATGELKTIDPKFLPSGSGGSPLSMYFDGTGVFSGNNLYLYNSKEVNDSTQRVTVEELSKALHDGKPIYIYLVQPGAPDDMISRFTPISMSVANGEGGVSIDMGMGSSASSMIMLHTAEYTP